MGAVEEIEEEKDLGAVGREGRGRPLLPDELVALELFESWRG